MANSLTLKKIIMYSDLLEGEPILMPYQSKPFNNDSFVAEEFLKLKEKFAIKKVIECGSCVGGTTKWLSKNFEKVTTIEINPDFLKFCFIRTKDCVNISHLLSNTTDVLPSILSNSGNDTLLFLDDHWNEYMPLHDELKIIKQSGLKPVIVVHDCKVPNEPELGFDSYKGIDISFENMKPFVDDIYGENGYDYHYNTGKTSTDVKRGVIYIYPKSI